MKYIVDTGICGAPYAKALFCSGLLAVTVAPSCHNYQQEVKAVCAIFAGTGTPVYAGAMRPMLKDTPPANTAPPAAGQPAPTAGHAVNRIIALAADNPGLTLVCLGPLSNLALAILKAPEILKNIAAVVVAGGAQLGFARASETAEYNIYCDAEAAHTVFTSGLNVTLLPQEAAENYYAAACIYSQNPTVAQSTYEAFIDIDISAGRTYGQTVIDPIGYNPITFERHTGEKFCVVSSVNEALLAAAENKEGKDA